MIIKGIRSGDQAEPAPSEEEITTHIGNRIRWRRRHNGITQQALGNMVGLRFQQIQKYECAANRVTASRLFRLAAALNVPIQYFFDGLPSERSASSAS